ncbi:hypothetical protein HMPREF9103_02724 [Lentilactobacillus parafarraginis F0439]|uniref:Uncharacterized protein n=1 Tax=Lentilactobacillus parafarraginis F0439 TaxID=797515 RepID=G9ZSK5_9LACO|nr:hypothetical protein HMPREF9103_02724 [Lentilactobacillus parafarraginis F0439]
MTRLRLTTTQLDNNQAVGLITEGGQPKTVEIATRIARETHPIRIIAVTMGITILTVVNQGILRLIKLTMVGMPAAILITVLNVIKQAVAPIAAKTKIGISAQTRTDPKIQRIRTIAAITVPISPLRRIVIPSPLRIVRIPAKIVILGITTQEAAALAVA